MHPDDTARTIKAIALQQGFSFCGISKAERMEKEERELETWLNQNLHGKMAYMANHFDKRVDPSKLVPGAKTVISLMFNYYPKESQKDPEAPKIARYAYGEDYHKVVKDRLYEMVEALKEQLGEIDGRVFVDSAPVLEKAWAKRSGIAWQGKNTNVINPKAGSYFFLAEIISDLEATADGPIKDYCGTCTACIDACPTNALFEPYKIDASRCISYLTIELKDEVIPQEFHDKMEGWAFGCDICQEVCPWNRFSKPHSDSRLLPGEFISEWSEKEWKELTIDVFNNTFKHAAINRTGYKGLIRNINALTEKKQV